MIWKEGCVAKESVVRMQFEKLTNLYPLPPKFRLFYQRDWQEKLLLILQL